jgi:TPR repeat protein
MTDKKDNYSDIPKNYREFYLSYTNNYEDSGFDKEYVEWLLDLLKNHPDDDALQDKDVQNNIGTIFEDGIMVKKDINKAVYWYEQAINQGDDLAMSNLADILRKGSQGYPKDLERAFELYKRCGLPYAHYRVGEFYENGWGTERDLDEAKRYYRLAYKERHALAVKKLETFDFFH